MNFTISTTEISHLGFAAIFFCISTGFFLLKAVTKEVNGPGTWSLSFLFNGIGFVFWADILPMPRIINYLIGEIFHMSGFLTLIVGVYRFAPVKRGKWRIPALTVFLMVWFSALLYFNTDRIIATITLRVMRSLLFVVSGFHILKNLPKKDFPAKRLAGISLLLWAGYIVSYGFINAEKVHDFLFGILVGFQVLAAFGLIALVIDRIHRRTKESEARVEKLEKLLPVCAHCKKIRDSKSNWHDIEDYIEKVTETQISHGICPDCLRTHFPEYIKADPD